MDDRKTEMILEQLRMINQRITNIENDIQVIKSELTSLDSKVTLLWGDFVAQSRYAHKKKFGSTLSAEHIRIETNRWVQQISNVLGDREGYILTTDVYKILGVDRDPNIRTHETIHHIINAMHHLGWEQKRFKDGKHLRWGYVKGDKRKHIYVFRDPISNKVTIGNSPSFMTEVLKP
jgi:hypothetical protein